MKFMSDLLDSYLEIAAMIVWSVAGVYLLPVMRGMSIAE